MSSRTDLPPAMTGEIFPEPAGFGPPLARPMTEDERRGFNWALEALQLWGGLMLAKAPEVPHDSAPVPLSETVRHGWRNTVNAAKALQMTLGRAI